MPFKFNPFTKKLDIVDVTPVPPGTVASLTGDDGAAVGPDGTGTIFIKGEPGTGVVFTGTPLDNTLTLTLPGGGFDWSVESANFTAASGEGYLINDSLALVECTLPSSPLIGDTFIIADIGGGTWQLTQNGGDTIQLGNDQTTVTTGTITSTFKGDTLMLVCYASGPGASWIGLQPVGNFTVS